MTNGTIMRLAALAGAMLLAGCLGGGGGAGTLNPEDVEKVRSDDRVRTMTGIYERADTLLVPALHLEFTSTLGGQRDVRRRAFRGTCEGTECKLSGSGVDGTIVLSDLITDDVISRTDISVTKLELGKRRGFDTLVVEGSDRISSKFSDEPILTVVTASTKSWGVWGKDGYAGLEISGISLSSGSNSSGMRGAIAYAYGDSNPRNPEGAGSATWEGPVEAISPRTFVRYEGKATLTIPNLAQASIDAEILVDGTDISEPSWKDMPLSQGSWEMGDAGKDYIAGNFHGPKHEEAYGVFETRAYMGAFGAMKQ